MVLIKEIELALKSNSNEVQAQEDEILADSVLELANVDFTKVDEFEDVAPGAIRKHVEADMRVAYPGKPTSRKRFFKSEVSKDITAIKSSTPSSHANPDLNDTHLLESQDEHDSSDQYEMPDNSESEIESTNEDSGEDLDSDFGGSILDEDEESGKSGSDVRDEDDDMQEGTGNKKGRSDDKGSDTEMHDEQGINIFSARARNIDADIAKGKSIHNQLSIWDKLIECRIKIQPALISVNKLQQKDDFAVFKSSLNFEEQEIVSQTYTSLADLMKSTLELQDKLLKLAPEYNQTRPQKRKELGNTSQPENESNEPDRKKKKFRTDFLEEIHEDFKPFRNVTIQKWNEKTRVSSGKFKKNDFSAFDLPTLKQIEEILLDRDRLLKRTQIKRSDYAILGKLKKNVPEENTAENRKNTGDYDPEIFDDDDFYHKLLRDFIEKKTSDVTDVSKRGKQWLELQKLRNKMKSKVDTRASKGRKLRFTVHNKMVNFMAPIPSFTWSDEAKNELFKSLFH